MRIRVKQEQAAIKLEVEEEERVEGEEEKPKKSKNRRRKDKHKNSRHRKESKTKDEEVPSDCKEERRARKEQRDNNSEGVSTRDSNNDDNNKEELVNVYVKNLPDTTTPDLLQQMFSPFAGCNPYLSIDPEQRCRGFGFISMTRVGFEVGVKEEEEKGRKEKENTTMRVEKGERVAVGNHSSPTFVCSHEN